MVEFFYKDGKKRQDFEAVADQVIMRMARLTQLPERIQLHFLPLDHRTYGGVDQRYHNRIAINSSLSLKEFIYILIHELIHVSQRETGRYTIQNGWHYWNGKPITNRDPETLPHREYAQLPWEMDVASKQQLYFNSILSQIE